MRSHRPPSAIRSRITTDHRHRTAAVTLPPNNVTSPDRHDDPLPHFYGRFNAPQKRRYRPIHPQHGSAHTAAHSEHSQLAKGPKSCRNSVDSASQGDASRCVRSTGLPHALRINPADVPSRLRGTPVRYTHAGLSERGRRRWRRVAQGRLGSGRPAVRTAPSLLHWKLGDEEGSSSAPLPPATRCP